MNELTEEEKRIRENNIYRTKLRIAVKNMEEATENLKKSAELLEDMLKREQE